MADLQRRGLQLPRAARRAGRLVAIRHRHRGRHARARPLGSGGARPPARHVRLRRVGRSRAGAALRARSLRHQALLLRPGRRRPLLRVRAEGAAAVPSGHRDRPRGPEGLPGLPVLPRRQDALQGSAGAPARPLPPGARRHRPDDSLLGGLLRPRLRPHREVLRGADREPAGRVGDAAPALRRARGRVPQRRARLEHRGLAGEPQLERAHEGLHGPAFRRTTATTRAPTRATSPTGGTSTCARSRSASTTSSARSRTSSTTWTTRRPGRDRSRSTWSPGREPRGQGHPRRSGRRRDLRRVHALPDRLLRAVHQGGHRRHHPWRQLRRHLRVDHPQPRRAAELQAADEGVLARRACSRTSTPATSG